ncbi:hypothetical protein lerEdw1_006112 [Lerista edwardsae]|nr:hypothetical protein lerEdw1_006112 [Lerista edwardsae]
MLGLNGGKFSAKRIHKEVTELWEKQEAASPEEERTNLLEQLLREPTHKSSAEKTVSMSEQSSHLPLLKSPAWTRNESQGSAWNVGHTSSAHELEGMAVGTFRDASAVATKALLHRLIFLAKISPELADKRDLAEYWEQLFVSLQRYYYQSEAVTGLLLLYPAYIVHVLESSSDVLYSVLRDLRDMEQQQRVLVQDAKILVMSHNLPSRLFQQWNFKVLNMTQTRLDDDVPQESVEAIISECLAAFLKLGMHLLKYPKNPKNLPDTVLEKAAEFIVPQDTLSHLLDCQELLSPAQYLQLYDSPVNILMDSGLSEILGTLALGLEHKQVIPVEGEQLSAVTALGTRQMGPAATTSKEGKKQGFFICL